MQTVKIENDAGGSRQVIATRNDEASTWHARLYVNRGETPTLVARQFRDWTRLEKWAAKLLA